jgi:hypothetical protein
MQPVPITPNVVSLNPAQARFTQYCKSGNFGHGFILVILALKYEVPKLNTKIQMLATINTPKVQAPFGVSLLHLVLIIQGYNQNYMKYIYNLNTISI